MSRPHILQIGPYPKVDEDALASRFVVHRLYEATDKPALLARVGPDIRAIATGGETGADRALIAACPNLEMIAVFGVGYDAVDLDACRENSIRLTNTPDVLTEDVADLGVGMALCLTRDIVGAHHWARSGDWEKKGSYPLVRRFQSGRAGILGLGRIGQAVGHRLASFNMEISYFARTPKPDAATDWTYCASPLELARRCDFMFVTLAATRETRGIVDRAVLEALGPSGMLINVSRGSNVDEPALIETLRSGALGFAALDVFDNEPKISPELRALPNVLLQPHHGSGTTDTRRAMGQLMRDNLDAHFSGRPLLTPVL